MTPSTRVVVGVDGSEASRTALRWAMVEARLRGAILDVLHAWHTPLVFVPAAYDAALVEEGRMSEAALHLTDRELAAIGADDDTSLVIEQSEAHSSPARALVEASRHAALVVVGRHGVGGFPHEPVSPKVVQVAHHAHCPVAVVPDVWNGGGRGVVVGVDGSAHAAAAMRWARTEAEARQTSLTAVLAWGLLDQHHTDGSDDFDPSYGVADARAALDAYVRGALGAAATSVQQEVMNDLPALGLIDAAAGAELLVVGARGLGGFRQLLLGSVSHRCLAHASVPTVVMRS